MEVFLDRQDIIDEEHLRLLRIGYFIAAGTSAFWIFFPLIYVVMGLFFFRVFPEVSQKPGEPNPADIGLLFAGIGGAVALGMAVLATLKFLTARALGQRRSKTLCFVTAAITCCGMPWGTALGVLTFLVLSRPSIAAKFEADGSISGAAT